MTDWSGYRLIVDDPGEAEENMARDEELLAAYRAGEIPPTWRLYTWREPAVTYGRSQKPPAWPGEVPVLPRVSGGGFVPHGADFTYCVVRERRSGQSNYEDIVAAVTATLRELGVPADVWRSGPAGAADRCFASLAPFDIHVKGKKIAGCAQRRFRDAILHHGSLAAAVPAGALRELGLWDEARTVTLESVAGRSVELAEFAGVLAGVTNMEITTTSSRRG